MAILHASGVGGTAFERASSLPNPNATMAILHYPTSASPGFSAIMASVVAASNPANYVVYGYNNASTILTIFTEANVPGEVQFYTQTINTWYACFLRLTSTSAVAHVKPFGTNDNFTSQTMTKSNFTPARFRVADDGFGDPVPAMRTSRWIVWSQTLSEADCLAFAGTSWSLAKAQQYGTVDSYVSLADTSSITDTSGNGRTITAYGTGGTTAADPTFPPDNTPKRLISLNGGRRLRANNRLCSA